jgi:sugar phosphate isomerase/epimerase
MDHTSIPLAAYLDEAGDDPIGAAVNLRQTGIKYVCLRQAWATAIQDASDIACQRLLSVLREHGLQGVALMTTIGNVPFTGLSEIGIERIKRVMSLAEYFGARMVRFYTGRADSQTGDLAGALPTVHNWMTTVAKIASEHNVVPIMEIDPPHSLPMDRTLFQAADVAKLLAAQPQWRLLYDPAALLLRYPGSVGNPFLKYWTLLKNRVLAVDLRDFKIGEGFRALGHGDSDWQRTLQDMASINYRGWYFLEPGLGRRHGMATSKTETFKMALTALDELLAVTAAK